MAISETTRERALAIYKNIRSVYDEKLASLRSDWQTFERNYRGIRDREQYKGHANLFINETHNAVESLTSRITRLVLSTDPPFSAEYDVEEETIDGDDMKTKGKVLQSHIAKQLRHAGIDTHTDMFTRNAAKYGTGILKYYWDYRQKEIYKNVPDRKGNPVKKLVRMTDYDDIAFSVIDPYNFYPIGEGESIDELDGTMERIDTTLRMLQKNEKQMFEGKEIGVYEFLDEVEEKGGSANDPDNKDSDKKSYRKYDTRIAINKIDKDEIPVELFELWIDFDIKGDGEKIPCVIAIANDIVIRCQANPFWHQKKPYLSCPYIPVQGEFWGIGVIELVMSDQAYLNDTFNQMCDAANYCLDGMWQLRQGSPTSKAQLVNKPGKVFMVAQIDADMKPLQTNQGAVLQTGIQVVSMIRDNMNNTTGNQPILQGQPLRSRTTATEIAGQEKHSMAKIVDVADRISYRMLEPLIKMTFEMDRQFLSNPYKVRIETDEGVKFQRLLLSDLDFDWQFKIISAMDAENKMVRQQQLIGFLNIIRGFPPQAMATPIFNILRRIWEEFGYNDAEQVIPKQVEQLFMQMVGAPAGGQPGQQGQRIGMGQGAQPGGQQNEMGNMLGALQQGQMGM